MYIVYFFFFVNRRSDTDLGNTHIVYFLNKIKYMYYYYIVLWGQGQGWWHMSCGGIACG